VRRGIVEQSYAIGIMPVVIDAGADEPGIPPEGAP
jgi:hypothetical protein